MTSSGKKILFGLVIFLMIGGIAAAVYWPKFQPSSEEGEEPLLTQKEKCLEDISKMNEEELIATVESFDYVKAPSASIREVRKISVISQLFDYLVCRIEMGVIVDGKKNEELYLMTKEFVERSASPENSKIMLEVLDETYAGEDIFGIQLALGDLNHLCPDRLPNICLRDISSYIDNKQGVVNGSLLDEYVSVCNNICSLLDQYSKDREKLKEETIYSQEWDDDTFRQKQYRFRTAIAYRFGGQDLAVKVCNIFPADNKEDCLQGLDYIVKLNLHKECDAERRSLESSICDIY